MSLYFIQKNNIPIVHLLVNIEIDYEFGINSN